jgi:formamidopyrimidine-DNA glycosylase
MPELPEVEITKNFLSNIILDKTALDVIVFDSKLRYSVPEEIGQIIGGKIIKLARRAKYLQIFFSNDQVLIAHLGMSGRILAYNSDYIPQKHDHIVIYLEPNTTFVYNDPRKFGFFDLVHIDDLRDYKFFKSLGLEPLSEELDVNLLYSMLQKSKMNIKKFLMDGSFIVGIGNIYACEILFDAKIHPLSTTQNISYSAAAKLLGSIKDILCCAIALGGSSIKNFVDPEGNKGHFAGSFQVYSRQNKQCFICSNIIEKIINAGRSTFFCPTCQASVKAL